MESKTETPNTAWSRSDTGVGVGSASPHAQPVDQIGHHSDHANSTIQKSATSGAASEVHFAQSSSKSTPRLSGGARPAARWGGTHTRSSIRKTNTLIKHDGTINLAPKESSQKGSKADHMDPDAAMREFTAGALATQSAAVLRIIAQLSDRQVKSISAMAELKSLAIKINYHCIRHRETIAAASSAAAAADSITDATLSEQLAAAGAAVGGGQGLQRLSQAGKLLISLDSGGGETVSAARTSGDTSTFTSKLIEQATDIRSSAVSLYASLKDCCSVIEAAGGLWVFANSRMGRDVRFMQSELSSGLATLLSSLAHAPADGAWPVFSGASSIGWPAGWVDASRVAQLNAGVVFPWMDAAASSADTAAADEAFHSKHGHGIDLSWLQRMWRRAAAQGEATALLRLAALAASPHPSLPHSLSIQGCWEGIPTEQQVASWRYLSSTLCLSPLHPSVLSAASQYVLQAILPCSLQQLHSTNLHAQRNGTHSTNILTLEGANGSAPVLPAGVLDSLFEYAQDSTPQLAMFIQAAYSKQEHAKDNDNDEWVSFWRELLAAAALSIRGVISHSQEQRQQRHTQPPLSSAAAWHVFAQWAGCSAEWQHFLQAAFESNLLSRGPAVSNGYVVADANIWASAAPEGTPPPSLDRQILSEHSSRALGTSGKALLAAFRQGGVTGGIRGAVGQAHVPGGGSTFSAQLNTRNEPIPSGSQFIGGDLKASAPLARVAAYTNGQLLGDRKLLGSVACETFPAVETFAPATKDLLFLQSAAGHSGSANQEAMSAGIRELSQSQGGEAQGTQDPSAASMQRLLGIAQSSTSRVLQARLGALRSSMAPDEHTAGGGALRRVQNRGGGHSQSSHEGMHATTPTSSSEGAASVVSSRLASGRLSTAASTAAEAAGGGAASPSLQAGGSSLNKRITAASKGSASQQSKPATEAAVAAGPPGGGALQASALPHPEHSNTPGTAETQSLAAPIDEQQEFTKDALQRVLNAVNVAAEAEHSVHSPHASPEEDEAADRAYSPFDVRSSHPAPQQLGRKARYNEVSQLGRFVFERLVAEAQERGLLLDESSAYVDSKANLSVGDLEVISDLEHFVHPRASVVGLLETWYGYNLAGSVTHMWGGAASGLGSVVERVQAGRQLALKLYMPPDDAADTISEAAHVLAREVAAGAMPEQVLAGEGAVGCMQPFSYKLSGPATLIGMSIRQNLRGFAVQDSGSAHSVVKEPQLAPCEFVGPALQDEYIRASAACLIDLAASLYDPPQFEAASGAAAPPSGQAFKLVTAAKSRAQHRDLRGIGAVMQVHLARAMLTASVLAGANGESACILGNLLDSGVLRPDCATGAHAYGSWILRREPQLAAVWYAIGAALGNSAAANCLGHMFICGKLHARLPALLMNCVNGIREAFGPGSTVTGSSAPQQLPQGVFASLLVVIARTQMQSEGESAAAALPQACCSPTQSLPPQQRVQEAAYWFAMAVEKHDAPATNNAAVCEELLSAPASVFGQPAYTAQYLTAARLGSVSGTFNLAYTLAKHARSAHELSEATAQMQQLAAAGDMRAKFHLACLLEGSFRKLQRIPQLSTTVLAPGIRLQEGTVWPTLQSLASSASTDAVSVQMYMQAAAFGNAQAAVKCGHICYSGVATQPHSFEKAIMYYLAAALGGSADGLNALACMVEEGKGFKGGPCTVRAEVLFRLAAGDAPGASILLWEVHVAGQASTAEAAGGTAHAAGSEQLLPALPVACLAAMPVPAATCSEAQLNLYWLYQKRAKALLVEVYCGQQSAPVTAEGRQLLAQQSSTASGMQALTHTISTRLHKTSAVDGPQNSSELQGALLREAAFYRQEAAAWLMAAARGGSAQAKRIQSQMDMATLRK